MRVFLDTNVFLYAAGQAHPQRDACVEVLQRVSAGTLEATSNSEVLQEILYVLVRRGRGVDGVALARHVAALLPDLLPVTAEDMRLACDLIERYSKLSVRDAVHAATMIGNGVNRLISVDEEFDQVREIHRVAPENA